MKRMKDLEDQFNKVSLDKLAKKLKNELDSMYPDKMKRFKPKKETKISDKLAKKLKNELDAKEVPTINLTNFSLKELMICSFRYCLGRQTILSNTFPDFLKDNWKMFEDWERKQIKKEIEDHKRIYGSIGDKSIDEPKWLDILNWKE